MSSAELEHLIRQYGYFAVLLGTFLEGETVLILGGIAAQQGHLRLPLVLLFAFIGSFSGDQVAYFIGRRFGPRLFRKSQRWQERVGRVRRILHRHRLPILLGFRFVYGIRIAGPIAFGASGVPSGTFMPLNALGALAWSCLIGGLGYAFGVVITPYLERAQHYLAYVVGGVAGGALLLGLAISLHRRLRRERQPEARAPEPAEPSLDRGGHHEPAR